MSSQTYGIVTTEATLAVIGKTYHRKYLKMMFNSKVNIQNNTVKSIFLDKIFWKLWKNYFQEIFGKKMEKIFFHKKYIFFLFLFWILLYALKKFFYLNIKNKSYLETIILLNTKIEIHKKKFWCICNTLFKVFSLNYNFITVNYLCN